jgi:rod shape determining protein RodA
MVLLVIYMVMMFMSGMSLRIIGGILVSAAVILIPVVLYMERTGSYRYDRLLSFFDPSMASADAIYQAKNSQIAIGNGGLWGTGLFQDGTYTALNFVPQDHTDFIFSAIGETMGFVYSAAAIVAFFYLSYRLLVLALNTADKFAMLVIMGVFSMMFFHIIYNIGMTVGITPVMGIPLPFLSYGGSNLIMNMAAIGLVINITLRKPPARKGIVEGEIDTADEIGGRRRRRFWRFGRM